MREKSQKQVHDGNMCYQYWDFYLKNQIMISINYTNYQPSVGQYGISKQSIIKSEANELKHQNAMIIKCRCHDN